MDQFSYLSVLISIIVALAISQVLSGLGRLIQLGEGVRLYWPSIVWAVILLLLDVETWWTMFGMRGHRDWNFFAFLVVLSQPIGLYLLAVLVFPNFDREQISDLRANYYSNVPWFFGLIVAVLLASIAKDVVLYGRLPQLPNLSAHIISIIFASVAAFTRRETYHRLLVIAAAGALFAYVGALFLHLQ